MVAVIGFFLGQAANRRLNFARKSASEGRKVKKSVQNG
jgi:hypothetical protein